MTKWMDRPIHEPNDIICCRCDVCGADIYYGGDYYDYNGDIVCIDCEPDYRKKHFRRYAE